ncbi:glutamine amidotransferase, partial [Gordonia sp. Z-3]|uniref:glutamine amidotransferase n=1 Tax=Gordonia sp. Z-3 TaxID=3115408 RepID=UPI002E2CE803
AGNDPMLVCGEYGHGRTTAFTSDLAPHWAPPEFLHWNHYPTLFNAILTWTSRQDETSSTPGDPAGTTSKESAR